MIDMYANGVAQEWARLKVMVITHDDGETWTASTPAFPSVTAVGTYPDIAVANLMCKLGRSIGTLYKKLGSARVARLLKPKVRT